MITRALIEYILQLFHASAMTVMVIGCFTGSNCTVAGTKYNYQ